MTSTVALSGTVRSCRLSMSAVEFCNSQDRSKLEVAVHVSHR